jgi:hypothetical protein
MSIRHLMARITGHGFTFHERAGRIEMILAHAKVAVGLNRDVVAPAVNGVS